MEKSSKLSKVRSWGRKKYMRITVAMTMALCALCVSASAADEGLGSTISAAFTSGFQKVVTDSIEMLSAMVPIAIGLAGTLFIIKKAMGWFKSMAK